MAQSRGDHATERLGQVQSLVRAFGILDILGAHRNGLTLTELANAMRLPRSTTHRLLTTMDALHYVEFEKHSSHWIVGTQVFALGNAVAWRRDVERLARPILCDLVREIDERVSVVTIENGILRHAGQFQPAGRDGSTTRPAAPLSFHTTASGKALLAFSDPALLNRFLRSRPLERRTQASIVDQHRLAVQLADIRTNGFAIDDQENSPGRRCVAVPIFDRKNRVCASLSISGDAERLPLDRLQMLSGTLDRSAHLLTNRLSSLTAIQPGLDWCTAA